MFFFFSGVIFSLMCYLGDACYDRRESPFFFLRVPSILELKDLLPKTGLERKPKLLEPRDENPHLFVADVHDDN